MTAIVPEGNSAAARERVEKLVRGFGGEMAGDRAFDEPWELRVFAMAVALHDAGHFDWTDFQLSLINSIQGAGDTSCRRQTGYYEHWINALEALLAERHLVDENTLGDETRRLLMTPRNANHHPANRQPVSISPATRTAWTPQH